MAQGSSRGLDQAMVELAQQNKANVPQPFPWLKGKLVLPAANLAGLQKCSNPGGAIWWRGTFESHGVGITGCNGLSTANPCLATAANFALRWGVGA